MLIPPPSRVIFAMSAVSSTHAEQQRGRRRRRPRQATGAAAATAVLVGLGGFVDAAAVRGAGGARGEAQEHGQQKRTPAHAEHQQRVLRPPGLHTQRAVRHQTVQNQNAPVGHVLHQLPDDRVGQRRPGHGRIQSRPVRAYDQAVYRRVGGLARQNDATAPGRYNCTDNVFYAFNRIINYNT